MAVCVCVCVRVCMWAVCVCVCACLVRRIRCQPSASRVGGTIPFATSPPVNAAKCSVLPPVSSHPAAHSPAPVPPVTAAPPDLPAPRLPAPCLAPRRTGLGHGLPSPLPVAAHARPLEPAVARRRAHAVPAAAPVRVVAAGQAWCLGVRPAAWTSRCAKACFVTRLGPPPQKNKTKTKKADAKSRRQEAHTRTTGTQPSTSVLLCAATTHLRWGMLVFLPSAGARIAASLLCRHGCCRCVWHCGVYHRRCGGCCRRSDC